MDKKALRTRIISALIFAVIYLTCILVHRYTFFIFFLIIAFLGSLEYFRLYARYKGHSYGTINRFIAGISGIIPLPILYALSSTVDSASTRQFLLIIPLTLTIICLLDLLRGRQALLFQLPYAVGTFLYPGLLLGSIFIAVIDYNGAYHRYYLLLVVCSVWAVDVGAYFVGSLWGRRKLSPRLSPNKTIEGALGGIFSAMLIAAIFSRFMDLSIGTGILIGLCCGILGITGDLYESKLKRASAVKDSGRIMPGHGGVLDRFDGLIFALPAAGFIILWAL